MGCGGGGGRRGLKFSCVSEPASRVLDCFTSGRLHIRVSGRLQFATVCAAKVNKKRERGLVFVIRTSRPRVFLCPQAAVFMVTAKRYD